MQAIVTVCAGILSEIPAPRAASLAMLDVFTSWITVPTQTYSINFGSTPVLFSKPTWRKIMEPNAIHKGFIHFLENWKLSDWKRQMKPKTLSFKIWRSISKLCSITSSKWKSIDAEKFSLILFQIFILFPQKQFTRLRKTAQTCYEQYIKSVFVSFWAPYVLLHSNFDRKY